MRIPSACAAGTYLQGKFMNWKTEAAIELAVAIALTFWISTAHAFC